jgi:hypothetical protein
MNEHNNPTTETIIKKLTVELLKHDFISVVPEGIGKATDKIKHENSDKTLAEHQDLCMDLLGINQIIPELEKKNKLFLSNSVLMAWLRKAETLGLASFEMSTLKLIEGAGITINDKFKMSNYSITSKGLETALKLQEHEDNERRFEQQSGISKVLQDNSSKSVTTARIALGVAAIVMVSSIGSAAINYIRLDKLEQKILSHDEIKLLIRSNEVRIIGLNSTGAITPSVKPVEKTNLTKEEHTKLEPNK